MKYNYGLKFHGILSETQSSMHQASILQCINHTHTRPYRFQATTPRLAALYVSNRSTRSPERRRANCGLSNDLILWIHSCHFCAEQRTHMHAYVFPKLAVGISYMMTTNPKRGAPACNSRSIASFGFRFVMQPQSGLVQLAGQRQFEPARYCSQQSIE